ncbi:MalY/PatB family protein [Dysgonomonas massiliensis]|uniref:MalY/PatB family protein n=1 Tax=Dysgonomonas massiliensis TaxID=2040292 RepID=UPI000C780265|nr:MalY/PatB family protein [Dysgonomonas massiliensis]
MKYNFDQIIDRSGTQAIKVESLEINFGRTDLIPMWVADMDFKSPQPIIDALLKRVEHGIFGYTKPSQEYCDSIVNWLKNRHDWHIQQEWANFIPGIVKGIAFVIDCFTQKGDGIVIQPPVYHPFRITTELHNRQVVNNPLKLEAGEYKMDLEDLEKKLDSTSKVLVLCNPHNPGGRVWTREELVNLAEICDKHNILVISDEIHSDLAYENDGHKHIPYASVSEKAAQHSITFMAPSKTFNIAGIVSSFAVIPNESIRQKFHAYLEASELHQGHIFAYTATEAAYNKCGEWLDEAKQYIWNNIQFVDDYLKENIPQIKAMIPQASFLVWLDCRELGLTQEELNHLFVDDAKLALNSGTTYGPGGEGFMRLNVGCPRSIIEKALNNLKKAISSR